MQHHSQLPSQAEFAAALNSNFSVRAEGVSPAQFTLIECNDVIATERQHCYSLLFRGPVEQLPIQALFTLENDQLGEMQLLLVPVKRDEDGVYFEAVMNHLLLG
jgi:hypothetical protein